MAAATQLRDTEEYAVETPAGPIGRVEEVRPAGLSVRTSDGRHALLRDRDVLTVDRERRWVVVDEHPALVELGTGEVLHPEPVDRLAAFRAILHERVPQVAERPLWVQVAALYGGVTLVVVAGIALVFVIAWLAAGSPY